MNLNLQIISMLASTAVGLWLGISLDTYERILGKRKSFRWGRLINDFLFWICQALIFFVVLYYINNGEIRFYLLLAVALGYSIYRAILDQMYQRMLEFILRWISRLTRFLVRITYILIINPTKGLLYLFYRSSIIIITTLWRFALFLLKLIFRPIILFGSYVDKKSGHPLWKQRKIMQSCFVAFIYRIKHFRSK